MISVCMRRTRPAVSLGLVLAALAFPAGAQAIVSYGGCLAPQSETVTL